MRAEDVLDALTLLSRLPLPALQETRGAAASWAYPLAGAVLGLIAAVAGWIALGVGVPAMFVAGLILLFLILITGGLHEDGLADTADGVWGGQTPERRLEIMKDSRIGSYGVIALVLSLGLRWIGLSALVASGNLAMLVAIAALSRVPMVWSMTLMPNARSGGLSARVGRPAINCAWIALGVGAAIGLLFLGWTVLSALFWGAVLNVGVMALTSAKINGQTGDTLGAQQQVTEISLLMVAAASLA